MLKWRIFYFYFLGHKKINCSFSQCLFNIYFPVIDILVYEGVNLLPSNRNMSL